MEKIRIYELAKELNTTSKRLIEKLLEIKIDVKNHMSYIEGNEVEALYKHIGMVSREGEKKSDDINNNSSFAPRKKSETKKADTQNIPTVLRTTEVKSDSFNNDKQKESNEKYKGNTDKRKDFKGGRRQGGGVKVSAASSGLRSGFVRDNGPIVQTPINKANKVNEPNKVQNVDKAVKVEEVKNEPIIAETKINISTEAKSTLNLSNKEQAPIKPDIKNEQPKIKEKDIKVKSSEEEHIITTKIKDTTAQKSDNQQQNKGKVQANEKSFKDKTTGKLKRQGEGFQGKQSDPSKDSVNKDRNIKPRQNSNQKLKGPKDLLDLPIIAEEKRIDENKREHQIKDISKDIKREQKREVPKSKMPDTNKKFKPRNINLDQSKGVSKILQEDEVLVEELIIPTPTVAKRPRRNTRPRRGRGQKGTSEASKMAVERAILTSVKIPETITVKDLAELLKKTAADVIKKLMFMDIMVTLNQEVDYDVASLIAEEYGIKSEKEIIIHAEDILFDDDEEGEEDEANLEPRPPVVVVMGHVDHGKTSLLDAIRETNVIDREQGGITQHIGAYTVKTNDRNITFLDTPGHEAFTSMRARGAKITDIAILVVAADDGVMPQTIEAINHAKAAGVTTIVAINKIDKPTSNPDRIKQQLAEYGLVSEDWGGDIIMVPVSAKSGENIDLLLEMVLLSADIMELKSNPYRQAKGTIIESKLDKNRGPITSLLVQRGTLNVGDSIITGITVGRIRAMNDDKGQSIKTAGPSTPVEILGLPEVSESGQLFYAVKDEKLARDLADKRKQQQREEHLKSSSMVSLEDLFNQIKEGQIKDLNIILKADVQGSVEALKQSIEKLTNPEVRINVIHGGVGAITESDVKLAEVSNAIIIGFNVRPGLNVSEIAEASSVDVKLYRVIYDAINDIESAMKGMLTPKLKEVIQGHVEIRQIYKASGIGTIGGSYVLDGKIFRNSDVRLLRNSVVVYEGKLDSLKRFKDDVKEVAQGYECGVLLERFNDIKEGDIVEAYTMEEIKVK